MLSNATRPARDAWRRLFGNVPSEPGTVIDSTVSALVAGQATAASAVPINLAELECDVLRRLIAMAGEDGVLACYVNGEKLNVPSGFIRMFPGALAPTPDRPLNFLIEAEHLSWMVERLSPGDLAIDIGASGGNITASLARRVGPAGQVIAFEPARRAHHYLRRLIALNGLDNVVAESLAISNEPGEAEFQELAFDPDKTVPWKPECSSIWPHRFNSEEGATRYRVPVVRLDDYLRDRPAPRLIKIDVEGFEVRVMAGALATIARSRPLLCIDIHLNVDAEGDTDAPLRQMLEPFGYQFQRQHHVLMAEPKRA